MGVLKVRKGEILEAETDLEYKNSLGQEAEISKGEKSVIGFDGLIHCLKKRVVIVPDDTMEVSGYSATGLSEFLTAWLDKSLDLEKNLDKSEHSLDDVLIVYAIVVIFATCFNMAHSKLIATIIWLFLPLLIRVYRLLRNKVIGESWEELCDKEYCAKCQYREEHENGMCNVDYVTGKCFVVKEKK